MFLNNEHSLKLLDFFRMRERTAEYCLSWEGGELLRSSFPIDDRQALERFKRELSVLVEYLDSVELPGFSFPLIEMPLKHLGAAGFTLELEELFALGIWAREFDKLVLFLSKARFAASKREQEPQAEAAEHEGDFDPGVLAQNWALPEAFNLIEEAPKLQHVYKSIFEVVTPDGEMRDLPELKRIRDAITRANRELLTIADSYRNDPDLRLALQSGEPTQRDGRTVLAVRANFRGRVKGIVHEVSSTGQTVFIEPAALVEKNNDLVQLEAKLRAEIFRILKDLTAELRKDRFAVTDARVSLAFLDQRLARAVQIRREELILPEIRDSGYTIWRARHPLLGKKAVPIDVDMPESARTLIVTGPNTGGKTVTLKTIGLFALMHQFGMGLPVALGTKLPVFDAVLADIGDEQSIDQSLSTFSGHMRVMAEIVKHATKASLVLLDELGAGTDPEEGCAIAMGLLDFFIERGCLTMATTHHGILKNYGYTRTGCLNASMEFDSTLLAPTYRIVMGIPGESRALEIAAQTGLVEEIVARARRYLSDERTDIGELIRGLNEKHRELEVLEREQKKRLKSATEDQRKADLAVLRVRQREVELRRHGLGELKILLGESRKTLENLVREVRESGASSDKTKDVKKFLADLSDSVERQYSILESEELEARADFNAGNPVEATDLREVLAEKGARPALVEGAEVVYGTQRKRARLIRKASNNTWIIEIGSVRLKASTADLLPVSATKLDRPLYDVELARGSDENLARASFELNLRGFRLAEALAAVERQIDLASLQGLSLFSIIHGTGEGVLGKGIHDYLRSSPVVEDYHFARPEEGGYGKTIVRLKV
ncbi:MAG: endonuclease MutS2 [Spirochaetae bacterium HGW-Spirochaetae-9]|nr:MAG: endonuclease MutS2 [Spirochaetae bacterium HGW-Spirochaetae-9]